MRRFFTINRLAASAATIGATAAVLTLTGSPAQADDEFWSVASSTKHSQTEFYSYGEHLYSVDTWADDHGATAQWRYSGDSAVHSYYNGKGYSGTQGWDLSLSEGAAIQIRACLQDGASGTPYSCGDWMNAHA